MHGNIGHNSVQTPHNGKLSKEEKQELRRRWIARTKEETFRRKEGIEARKERHRLVRLGRIIPENRMPPQMLVKVDGKWQAEIKTF